MPNALTCATAFGAEGVAARRAIALRATVLAEARAPTRAGTMTADGEQSGYSSSLRGGADSP